MGAQGKFSGMCTRQAQEPKPWLCVNLGPPPLCSYISVLAKYNHNKRHGGLLATQGSVGSAVKNAALPCKTNKNARLFLLTISFLGNMEIENLRVGRRLVGSSGAPALWSLSLRYIS